MGGWGKPDLKQHTPELRTGLYIHTWFTTFIVVSQSADQINWSKRFCDFTHPFPTPEKRAEGKKRFKTSGKKSFF